MAVSRRQLLAATGTGMLAAAPRRGRAQEAVELTMWAWTPNAQDEVNLFQQAHPNIKVTLVNAGQGLPHYTKIRTALKAGSGLADVVQMEFYMQRTFQLANALIDLVPYGADKIAGDFIPWTWTSASTAGKVYGIPWDSGPVALLYRQDILDRYKIAPPKTWDEFADSATKLAHDANDVFLADLMLNNIAWMTGWFWQAGWNPFKTEGTNISIAFNDAAAKKVAAYWQKLLDAKAIEA
ncbi:MAG: extracellular solute-binding protein, partial [Acetobacteraceae bacterium]|nr:extracellular solute-binding protein [Acetobacteraceae bacterium]